MSEVWAMLSEDGKTIEVSIGDGYYNLDIAEAASLEEDLVTALMDADYGN